MRKVAVTCAVTGAETTRDQNPNLPLTPEEIASSAQEACEAGAAILHLHVRDRQGNPTQDVEVFRETMALIRERCGMVIEVTTGGAVGMTLEERMQPIQLDPELASLDCGTVNFGDDYFVNTLPMMRECARAMKSHGVHPTLECFDLSHIDAARILIDEGLVEPPLHYGLVLNVPGAVRFDEETLAFFARRLAEGSFWTAIAIGGRAALRGARAAVDLGGFVRVGFEDNIYLSKGTLAKTNAELVKQAVEIIEEKGAQPATPDDVRNCLKLSRPD